MKHKVKLIMICLILFSLTSCKEKQQTTEIKDKNVNIESVIFQAEKDSTLNSDINLIIEIKNDDFNGVVNEININDCSYGEAFDLSFETIDEKNFIINSKLNDGANEFNLNYIMFDTLDGTNVKYVPSDLVCVSVFKMTNIEEDENYKIEENSLKIQDVKGEGFYVGNEIKISFKLLNDKNETPSVDFSKMKINGKCVSITKNGDEYEYVQNIVEDELEFIITEINYTKNAVEELYIFEKPYTIELILDKEKNSIDINSFEKILNFNEHINYEGYTTIEKTTKPTLKIEFEQVGEYDISKIYLSLNGETKSNEVEITEFEIVDNIITFKLNLEDCENSLHEIFLEGVEIVNEDGSKEQLSINFLPTIINLIDKIVYTSADLNEITKTESQNKIFVLANNLTIDGSGKFAFQKDISATLDGNNKSISLKLEENSSLFNIIEETGVIKNLVINRESFYATQSNQGNIAKINKGMIDKVKVNIDYTGSPLCDGYEDENGYSLLIGTNDATGVIKNVRVGVSNLVTKTILGVSGFAIINKGNIENSVIDFHKNNGRSSLDGANSDIHCTVKNNEQGKMKNIVILISLFQKQVTQNNLYFSPSENTSAIYYSDPYGNSMESFANEINFGSSESCIINDFDYSKTDRKEFIEQELHFDLAIWDWELLTLKF